ncbi:tRNA(Ile)-lysidine synthetase-like protein [Bradyrhizobium ottawaense]
MSDDDNSPISTREARRLFAGLKSAPALVLAVSGGPDSVALMWLAARWRRSLARGPSLTVVTIDHGLRREAAREAREVKRLATELGLPHRTLRWRGAKPKTGLPAAAREARYRLLAQAARAVGASHVLTAHTRDDQAETLLMRLLRGSGLAGLSAMASLSERDGIVLARPLLEVPKAQLIATLKRARIGFADDPTNRDTAFTRPRLRGAAAAPCGRGWRCPHAGAARGPAGAGQCGGRAAGRRRRALPPFEGSRRCAAGRCSKLRGLGLCRPAGGGPAAAPAAGHQRARARRAGGTRQG